MSGFLVFWLILTYMISKAAEDVTWAVKGKPSPRIQARERRTAADASGAPPINGTHRMRRAVTGYLAGLIEDSAAAARTHRRKGEARRSTKGWKGHVGTQFNASAKRWTVTCDRCGWTSRPYATEPEANAMVDQHAGSGCTPTGGPAAPTRRPPKVNATKTTTTQGGTP